MLDIICDYCNKKITTRQNKTAKPKKFRLEENICKDCKNKNLDKAWDDKSNELNKQWNIVRAEKEKFFHSVLRTQETEWFELQKINHYGSFYKETK